MFYRRKFYVVNNEFVDIFNRHFIETNLPNQLKNGARLVGRWMVPHSEKTTEIFAIWEYDSIEKYMKRLKRISEVTKNIIRRSLTGMNFTGEEII